MFCPYCGFEKTKVLNTMKGLQNKRYRVCDKCKRSFVSIEALFCDPYWQEYAKATKELGDLKGIKKE